MIDQFQMLTVFWRLAIEIELALLFPGEMECYFKQAPSTKTSTHAVNDQYLFNQIKSGSSLICFIQWLEYLSTMQPSAYEQ